MLYSKKSEGPGNFRKTVHPKKHITLKSVFDIYLFYISHLIVFLVDPYLPGYTTYNVADPNPNSMLTKTNID